MQNYMLEVVCKQADIVTIEEMLARKRAEALAFGAVEVNRDLIVEIIRNDRDSR